MLASSILSYSVALVFFVRWLAEHLVRKHVIVDRDTQLFSCSYFDTALELYVAIAHRKQESLSLICFLSLAKNGSESEEQIRVLQDFATPFESEVGIRAS